MYLVPIFVWLLFAVGSCAGGGASLISGMADRVDALERVSAVDGGTVELDAGHKYVYYDNGTDETSFLPAGEITITDPAGNPVELKDINGEQTYSADGSSGLGILQFDAPSDGTYTVSVEGATGTGELLIGENIFAAAKTSLIIFVGVGSAGFIIAVIIVIIIARQRGKSKREIRQGGGGGYGGGGGWPGGGQPVQPQGGFGAPASYPPQGGFGAPASYPPAGGGYQQPPPSYPPPGDYQPPPSSFPPQGGGFPPAGGGYQPPPGGFPPPGS
jgi:hypothetical protein